MNEPQGTTYNTRALIILAAITQAGGTASTREIWLRISQGKTPLSITQVNRMLSLMSARRHVRSDRRSPPLWTITTLGRDWVSRQKRKK